jgi:hypothetical protein
MKLTNTQILKKLENGDALSDHWKATRMFIGTIEIPYNIGLKLINSQTVQKHKDDKEVTYYKLAR